MVLLYIRLYIRWLRHISRDDTIHESHSYVLSSTIKSHDLQIRFQNNILDRNGSMLTKYS